MELLFYRQLANKDKESLKWLLVVITTTAENSLIDPISGNVKAVTLQYKLKIRPNFDCDKPFVVANSIKQSWSIKMQLEIRNYYEVLLMEILSDEGLMDELPEDYLADLCCVTLNQLPVRYVRHLVDTYFFEDYNELQQLKREIQTALEKSRAFLKQNLQKRLQEVEASN